MKEEVGGEGGSVFSPLCVEYFCFKKLSYLYYKFWFWFINCRFLNKKIRSKKFLALKTQWKNKDKEGFMNGCYQF